MRPFNHSHISSKLCYLIFYKSGQRGHHNNRGIGRLHKKIQKRTEELGKLKTFRNRLEEYIVSFPSKTTDFNASYCLVPLVSALFYLICSTIPPMHSENVIVYTTMKSFHQLTVARVREEHSPSRAASRVKMKEARKKAGDDDFSRLLCHEYSLCACLMHARTRMRTHAH